MLSPTQKMEQYSLVHIRAVVTLAGFQMEKPEVDDDSIDGTIIDKQGRRPRIEFQAKCTALAAFPASASEFPFDLSIKNYDDLRAETILPRLLIVVVILDVAGAWNDQSENELTLRRCGYWLSLREYPAVDNPTTKRVQIPRSNLLTPISLARLMASAERGTPL
jgi:hypothetical protein